MKIQNPIINAGLAPILGASRYALTFAALVALWVFDARSMNNAFDANLALIKWVGNAIDPSGHVEATLRAFSAEKMLLFAEISVAVWLVGKLLWWVITLPFRRRLPATTRATPVATEALPPPFTSDAVASAATATKAPPPSLGSDAATRLDSRSGPSMAITEKRTNFRAER